MVARKKLTHVDVPVNADVRGEIEQRAASEGDRAKMLKDVHLIEAAAMADGIVVSRDELARGLFSSMAADVADLGTIVWINPEKEQERPVEWLQAGAGIEGNRMLGSMAPQA